MNSIPKLPLPDPELSYTCSASKILVVFISFFLGMLTGTVIAGIVYSTPSQAPLSLAQMILLVLLTIWVIGSWTLIILLYAKKEQ